MANIGNVIADLKPVFVMVMVQVAYVGLSILYKLVVEDGMSMSVLIAYRTLFATSFVVPLAFFMERWHLFLFYYDLVVYRKICHVYATCAIKSCICFILSFVFMNEFNFNMLSV